jgi:hypothetical protein
VQLALAWWLEPTLIVFLLLTWAYLALMSREFFAREWLKARPLTYLWSHMLIMPLIDLYATACDWRLVQEEIPRGLFWFLVISFFNGVVIEFGRKMRAPEHEETGVPTYTALWGQRKAVIAWLTALALTAISATVAASLIGFTIPILLVLAFLLVPRTSDRAVVFATADAEPHANVRDALGRLDAVHVSHPRWSSDAVAPRAMRFIIAPPVSRGRCRSGREGARAGGAERSSISGAGVVRDFTGGIHAAGVSAGVRQEVTQPSRQLSAGDHKVAVRSSASDEDGAQHSFAGQLESYLFVAPDDVPAKAEAVWRSGFSERILAYRREHALSEVPPVCTSRVGAANDRRGCRGRGVRC